FPGLVSPEQRPLALKRAAYQGEPIVMALAVSRAVAEDALELIEVEWCELPAVTDLAKALDRGTATAHPDLADNLAWATELHSGNQKDAFARAAVVLEEEFVFERHTGVTLEPRGVLASWNPAGETLEVRISHQMPHQMQLHLSDLLDIPVSRVRVIC